MTPKGKGTGKEEVNGNIKKTLAHKNRKSLKIKVVFSSEFQVQQSKYSCTSTAYKTRESLRAYTYFQATDPCGCIIEKVVCINVCKLEH